MSALIKTYIENSAKIAFLNTHKSRGIVKISI